LPGSGDCRRRFYRRERRRAVPDSLGLFVVVEGPNGVGKTTVCESLTRALVATGATVHATAEPTQTSLGKAIRELDSSMPAYALALSCAADRCDHLAREIQPRLAAGASVICDRYLPSSLVLQRIDGLDTEWIWVINKCAVQPDLTVYLEDDPETISARLDQRGRRSRFETKGSPALELNYYQAARDFLSGKNWKQTTVDCRLRSPGEIAEEIIAQLTRARSP
jgi:dTMP kinase